MIFEKKPSYLLDLVTCKFLSQRSAAEEKDGQQPKEESQDEEHDEGDGEKFWAAAFNRSSDTPAAAEHRAEKYEK